GVIYRFGKYVGLTEARLERAAETVRGRGWVAVALGRALPGVRIGAVIGCGLAGMPVGTFTVGLIAGTILFVAFHTLLGYFAGPGVGAILDSINISPLALLLVLAFVGLAGWIWIRRRRTKAGSDAEVEPLIGWAAACCPVCLAAAAVAKT